jgi:hypothetical protein
MKRMLVILPCDEHGGHVVGELELHDQQPAQQPAPQTVYEDCSSSSVGWTESYAAGWERTFGRKPAQA